MTMLIAALCSVAQAPAVDGGGGHGGNAVFRAVTANGLAVGTLAERLPAPTFPDGLPAGAHREAIRALVGSDRAVEDFLRDSVSAPFLLRPRDVEADGAVIRAADLYFALRADLDAIDPDAPLGDDAFGPVEAANMRFEARPIVPDGEAAGTGRFIHSTGRLLDRIAVESTSRVEASRSADSVVVASMTDRRFDDDDRWPNRWQAIVGRGSGERLGPAEPYPGGIGYAKLTRLADMPGVVLVELHFAFAEPTSWFDGNPILRSKFTLIARDQVRQIRRELAQEAEGR